MKSRCDSRLDSRKFNICRTAPDGYKVKCAVVFCVLFVIWYIINTMIDNVLLLYEYELMRTQPHQRSVYLILRTGAAANGCALAQKSMWALFAQATITPSMNDSGSWCASCQGILFFLVKRFKAFWVPPRSAVELYDECKYPVNRPPEATPLVWAAYPSKNNRRYSCLAAFVAARLLGSLDLISPILKSKLPVPAAEGDVFGCKELLPRISNSMALSIGRCSSIK